MKIYGSKIHRQSKWLLSIVLFFMSLKAQALGVLPELGKPGYGGSGCVVGSASGNLSPDKLMVHFLLDDYMAEAGYKSGKTVDTKNCNLSIPVNVPAGYSVRFLLPVYKGYNSVPSEALTQFKVEYFWNGNRNHTLSKNFTGPLESSFTLGQESNSSVLEWSPCGKDIGLRVSLTVTAWANQKYDQTLSIINGNDSSIGKLLYQLQWKRCTDSL